jgi:uncharacterized membrane protein YccC
MGTATGTWTTTESDPQRRAILAAADRLLAGFPRRSTGNLSTVQLAIEAGVKYWVVAQKHTDLRDHFQQLAAEAKNTPEAFRKAFDAHAQLKKDHAELRKHCADLEELVQIYALANNELSLENQRLRQETAATPGNVTPMRGPRRQPRVP